MKNKRGQFYIIAAIIIVLAIATIASVKTYTITKSKPETITDMSQMLNLEGSKVVDYGIYNGGGETLQNTLENFQKVVQDYSAEKLKGAEIILAYKTGEDITITSIKSDSPGTITTPTGAEFESQGKPTSQNLDPSQYTREPAGEGRERITINLLGQDTTFELGYNEIFYFMVAQEQGGERYVEKKDQPNK